MNMKMIRPLLFTILTAFSLGAFPVHAETAAPVESKPAATDQEMDQFYGEMQAHYRLMQEQMQKIRQTRDPGERRKLMQEHWMTLHAGVGMMDGGWGMGRGMMGGGWGMGPQGLSDLSADQRTKITKIQDETRRKHWDLTGKVMEEQARLRDLDNAPKRDPAAIANAHKKISELQRRMYEESAEAHKRMEAVLTKEQKEKSWHFWRNW